jgi:hypothetical protein
MGKIQVSVFDIAFWLLLASVFFGVYLVIVPERVLLGTIVSIASMALLYALAIREAHRLREEGLAEGTMSDEVVTGGLAVFYVAAMRELDNGTLHGDLWEAALRQRDDSRDQTHWYLLARARQLKMIAEGQAVRSPWQA